jgi:hypothetical protein
METLQRTANRGSVSTGYDIDNSVKLEPDNSESFNKTFGSAGNRKTWSYSCWIKKTELFSSNGGALISAYPDVNNRLKIAFSQFKIQVFGKVSGSTTVNVRTNRLYRDTSAFYHILVVFDTTQGTAANRVKIYTNGVLEDSFDQTTYPSQNNDEEVGNSSAHYIGQRGDGSSDFYAGYITEINYVNGQALAPTDFGEFDSDTGIWIPKAYSGSYGTNGFYLDFADASDLGDDESGNGNDFTEVNITSADQATDTPTNNFCIGNALVNFAPGGQTLTEGATKFTNPSGQNWQSITGTFGLTSGKWYWEFKTNGTGAFVGIADVADSIIPQNTGGYFLGYGDDNSATTKSLGMYSANGVIYNDAGSVAGASYSSSNIVGVALDMDNRKIHFAVDNTWAGSSDPANNTNGATWNTSWSDTVFPAFSCAQNNNVAVNYGGYTTISISSSANDGKYGTFEYAPPTGYYAITTQSLALYG